MLKVQIYLEHRVNISHTGTCMSECSLMSSEESDHRAIEYIITYYMNLTFM